MLSKPKLFSADRNHAITTAEANSFRQNFREYFKSFSCSFVFFAREALEELLAQPYAIGFRYYYSNPLGDALVLVPTAADGNDLLNEQCVKASMPKIPLTALGEYDPNQVSHSITPSKAAVGTSMYQNVRPKNQPIAGFYGKNIVRKILQQLDCQGISFYFGASCRGKRVTVLVGIDSCGRAMWHGSLAEMSAICPPYCPTEKHLLNYSMIEKSKIQEIAG